MLTQKYYDVFAEIFKANIDYEIQLYEYKSVDKIVHSKRLAIVVNIIHHFIEFMQKDNSEFDVKEFKKTCGLN